MDKPCLQVFDVHHRPEWRAFPDADVRSRAQTPAKGVGYHEACVGRVPAGLAVVNARIAALPPCQEFKHFGRQIYRKNDKSATNNSTKVAFAATWRCIEYEALIQQFVYAVTAYPEAAHVVIAWADLYKTIRDVAPTLFSIGTAFSE